MGLVAANFNLGYIGLSVLVILFTLLSACEDDNMTGVGIVILFPIFMWWQHGTYTNSDQQLYYLAGSALAVSTVFFFMRYIWTLRGQFLLAVVFAIGMGYLLSPWPISKGLVSTTAMAWIDFALTALFATLSFIAQPRLHPRGYHRGLGFTVVAYVVLLLLIVWKIYLCGNFKFDSCASLQRAILEKRAEFYNGINSTIESQTHTIKFSKLSAYDQAIKYRDGDGGERDIAKARELFERTVAAKEARWMDAEFALIEMDLRDGSEGEKKVALGRLAKLADDGAYKPARKLLAKMIAEKVKDAKTKEVIPDLERAVRYGSEDAMLRLGRYYAKGEGFFNSGKDEEKARKYLNMAKEKGSYEAVELLKELD